MNMIVVFDLQLFTDIRNSEAGVMISGSDGNDYIINDHSDDVTIYAGAGDDTILTSGLRDFADGGTGDDSLINYQSYTTLNGGNGNDFLINRGGNYPSLNAGDGDDYIYMGGSYATISAGGGDDLITLHPDTAMQLIQYVIDDGNDTVYGFKSNDTLHITDDSVYQTLLSGSDVIVSIENGSITLKDVSDTALNITGGILSADGLIINKHNPNTLIIGTDENDSVYNAVEKVIIETGNGNDSVYNAGKYVCVDTGDGNDSIINTDTVWEALIDSGNGNDFIKNTGGYSNRINTGAGEDSVFYHEGSGGTINTGADDDFICSYHSWGIDIKAGTGNDIISLESAGSGVIIEYASGDGDDTVYGFGMFDTLKIAENEISSYYRFGNDYIVEVGTGSITFKNIGDELIRLHDSDNNMRLLNYAGIYNGMSTTAVEGTSSSDTIINFGDKVTVNAGAGNDSIHNRYSWNNTIDAGDGNDIILNDGYHTDINAGDGDDSVCDFGRAGLTINGGKGNDFISLAGYNYDNLIKYAEGDGNDTVYGFNVLDTLKIISGEIGSHYKSGNDYIVEVGNGSITFKDIGDGFIRVRDSNDRFSVLNASIYNFESNTAVTGTSADDVIFNNGSSLKIDAAVGDDTICNYDGDSVTIDVGAGNDSVCNHYGDKISIHSGDGNDFVCNFSGYNVSINAGDGNDTILDNAGGDIRIDAGAGNDSIVNENGYGVSINGGAGNDTIGNTGMYATVNGGTDDDLISLNNDPLHSSGYNNSVVEYADGDGNDTVYGFTERDTLKITSGEIGAHYKSGNDYIVEVGTGSITFKNIGDGLIQLCDSANRMSALNCAGIYNGTSTVTVTGTSSADSILNVGEYSKINAGAGDDSIFNFESTYRSGYHVTVEAGMGNDYVNNCDGWWVSINGGDGNDTVCNSGWNATIDAGNGSDLIINNRGSNYVSIKGGAGNDSIYNFGKLVTIDAGKDNDLIKLGSSADSVVIKYAAGDGNDVIQNFNSKSTLNITDGSVYQTLSSGSDVLVSIESGSITFKNARDHVINITGGVFKMADGLTISNSTANTVIVGSANADSSSRSLL